MSSSIVYSTTNERALNRLASALPPKSRHVHFIRGAGDVLNGLMHGHDTSGFTVAMSC